MKNLPIKNLTEWLQSMDLTPFGDATLKSSLLLGLALCLTGLLRKQAPALRSWILSLALWSLPLVFGISFLIPDWRWQAAYVVPALPGPGALIPVSSNALPPLVIDLKPATLSVSDKMLPVESAKSLTWSEKLFLVWAAGVGFLSLRVPAIHFLAWRQRRKLAEVHRGGVLDQLNQERLGAGLRRRPALFLTREWVMPSTRGILRPAIVLPREAASWPAQRLKHVLWHEMAHIARRDVLASSLSWPACILLWFNPLVWIAWAQMRDLREAACDDWVISRGHTAAPDYTADLLAIVCRQSGGSIPAGGLAMAQGSKVGARIRRLLGPGQPSRGLTTMQHTLLAMAWVCLAAATTFLISCRTADKAETPSASATVAAGAVKNKVIPGAAKVQFRLLEISHERGKENVVLSSTQSKSESFGSRAVAFKSLRALSQQKGVDLLSLPETREGQSTLLQSEAMDVELSGEKSDDGQTILTQARITRKKPSPQPGETPSDVQTYESMRIPNGGFVLLPGLHRELPDEKAPTWIQRLFSQDSGPKKQATLAIAAISDPAPPAAAGHDLAAQQLPGDASLPRGAKLISYELKFLEFKAGATGPASIPKGPCSRSEAEAMVASLLASRPLSAVSYPNVWSLAECEVDIRSIVITPCERPRKPGEPKLDQEGQPIRYVDQIEFGTKIRLIGHPGERGAISTDFSLSIKDNNGKALDPESGRMMPVVESFSHREKITLDAARPSYFMRGLGPANSLGKGLVIVLTVGQKVNP